jgi:DNA polymerase-3 subunit beta
MKFSVPGDVFSNTLSKISSVIPTRSTLPILENILFELKGNELVFLASDLEIFIKTRIEVSGRGDGKAAIPAKRLLDISRTLTSDTLNIECNERNKIILKTKNGRYTLSGENPEEFPVPEEKNNMNRLEFEGTTLTKVIARISHAVNHDELRRNMAGILFDMRKDEMRFVATDGFRLGKVIKKLESDIKQEIKIIVPAKTCNMMVRHSGEENAVLEFDENDIKITLGNVMIYSKLIDETFPNYETVIPKDNDKELKIDKDSIMTSLNRAKIFADMITKRVRLEIGDKSMVIKADNPEIGAEGEETIDCSFSQKSEDSKPFLIAFNADYLIDTVKQIESEEVLFKFGTSSKAAVAFPTEQETDEEYMELIMPVRMG